MYVQKRIEPMIVVYVNIQLKNHLCVYEFIILLRPLNVSP